MCRVKGWFKTLWLKVWLLALSMELDLGANFLFEMGIEASIEDSKL